MSLNVLYDTAQRRQVSDRTGTTASGTDFVADPSSLTWVEPVTDTLMLLPSPLEPEWHTTSTGRYSRLNLAAFGLAASTGGWQMQATKAAGATRIYHPDGMSVPAVTLATYGKNRGIFFSAFAANVGDEDDAVLADVGWGNSGTYASGVAARVWAGGKVDIWRGGQFRKQYKIGILGGSQVANSYLNLLLLPCRRRELLVYSITAGDGFVHVFDEIPEDEPNPVITPDEKMWFYIPKGMVDGEFAPLQFATSGSVMGAKASFGTPPKATQELRQYVNGVAFGGTAGYLLHADTAFAGATGASVSLLDHTGAAFVKNGVNKDVRLGVTLTGDGAYSPFVYLAHAEYKPEFANTPEVGESVMDKLVAGTFRLDSQGAAFDMELKDLDELDTRVPKIKRVSNRPVDVMHGPFFLMRGISETPDVGGEREHVARLNVSLRSRLKLADKEMFNERVPLVGMDVCRSSAPCALRMLLHQIGLTDAEINLEDVPGAVIGRTPPAKCGKAETEIQIGDKAADWIRRLVDDYLGGFVYGFRPVLDPDVKEEFFIESPETIAAKPSKLTLYKRVQDAIDAGRPKEIAHLFVYRRFNHKVLEPEANQVRVTGWNPREGRLLQSFLDDLDSQDPTLDPADRPDNWVGGVRKYGLGTRSLNRQEDVDRACELLYNRLTPALEPVEWFSEFMSDPANGLPIWQADKITLDGEGDVIVGSFIFGVDIDEPNPEDPLHPLARWRETRYTGSLNQLVGVPGTTLGEIQRNHRRRVVSRQVTRPGSEFLLDGFSLVAVSTP